VPSEAGDDTALERLRAALAPRLSLTRELGRGGMSVVYAAHEARLERDVAVKVLVPSPDGDVDAERFRREILLLARLQHPHVVPVLRDGVADGRPYFVMPLVEGESLRERLRRGGPLPVGEAVRVLRAVAAALAYAHARGVVHRDVKPDNVLLSAGGAATVSDFGVARAIAVARAGERGSDEGLVVGTPAYMAPEQAAGDPEADHRVDLYAFGVLAYEVLTGATPFAGRSGLARLTAQLTEPPPPIAERRPDLPRRVASLVMRCLQLDPAHRPAEASYLVSVLDALLAPGGEVERRDPPRAPRATRVRTAFALGAAVTLAVVALAGARWGRDAPADAAGADAPRRRVLVADFGGAGADPVLSGVLAEAVRADLGASATLTTLSAAAVARAARALCAADAPALLDAARAVALAAAAAPPAAAVVDGAVRGVEGARVVTLRALEPATGRVLAAHRATANALAEVMPTVDRLAGQLLRDIERRPDAPPAAGAPPARPCVS
jgi:serine/threonine-protein kinase